MKVINNYKYQTAHLIPCYYCVSENRTMPARVEATNIFGEKVNVCRYHYRKWVDADFTHAIVNVKYLNGFTNFTENVPVQFIEEVQV